ncbi:uncharacterized protein LOC115525320 isoform X3 [Lynx canadensis]|uniref:uncharacterized protein LOC115525320 isoform X3 n=1 Tax=Lynx canadensis TaxID=61383 RepID=UPI0011B08EF6|nr:uncharacterized protein LOC115525320 isoform X3 [Lynx canadensis]
MSDVVATEGTAEGISTNEIQSVQVGQADAPDLAQRLHSKLRDFLKKNLQSLGFIMSGSLTISCTRKQTEFLIEVSIGANIISTLLSSTGIILLSVNLVDIVLLECWELPACSLVKSFITNIVILQMILTCVQIFISFSLCGLTYTMDGKEISWASALSCLIRSHSEDPYQDLLTQPETYEDLVLQDIDQVHSHP